MALDQGMKIVLPFKLSDYPVGSYLYFFKKVKIQKDSKTRKSGEVRHFWDYAYSKIKVTHHVPGGRTFSGLVGVEGDDSNEGFDPKEFRNGHNEGHFIIPEWLFLGIKGLGEPSRVVDKLSIILNDGTGNGELNHIVKTCKTELKNHYHQKVPWHKYNQSR